MGPSIKLKKELWERVKKVAEVAGYSSPQEFVSHVVEKELAKLEDALEAAEAQADSLCARKVLLTEVVGMAVERRRWVMSLQNDPVMVRLLGEHEPFRKLMTRLLAILLDEPDDTEARISAALFSGAIAGTVINPLVDDIDDDTLRSVLIHLTARMFKLPD